MIKLSIYQLMTLGFGAIIVINALKEGAWAPFKKAKESIGAIKSPINPLKLRSGTAPKSVREWKPL